MYIMVYIKYEVSNRISTTTYKTVGICGKTCGMTCDHSATQTGQKRFDKRFIWRWVCCDGITVITGIYISHSSLIDLVIIFRCEKHMVRVETGHNKGPFIKTRRSPVQRATKPRGNPRPGDYANRHRQGFLAYPQVPPAGEQEQSA